MVRLRRVRIDAPGWSRRRAGRGFIVSRPATRSGSSTRSTSSGSPRSPSRPRGGTSGSARGRTATSRPPGSTTPSGASTCTTSSGRCAAAASSTTTCSTSPAGCPLPGDASARTSRSTGCRGRRCSRSRSGCSTWRTCGWAARGTRSSTARTGWRRCCARTCACWHRRRTATPGACTCTSPPSPGQVRDTVVEDDDVATLVRTLTRRRDDGPELLAWRDDDGGWHDVTSADVGAYVKERLGDDATPKDFRTWHATVLAARGLADAGRRSGQRPRTPPRGDRGGARRRRGARQHPRRVPRRRTSTRG